MPSPKASPYREPSDGGGTLLSVARRDSKFAPPTPVELPPLDESPEPDLTSATPLQVLEHIAVHGKSETARVQALKVLVDRQHQLERERTECEQRQEPAPCPRCAEREAETPYDDPEEAARIIVEIAELGPDAVRAALGVPSPSGASSEPAEELAWTVARKPVEPEPERPAAPQVEETVEDLPEPLQEWERPLVSQIERTGLWPDDGEDGLLSPRRSRG